jgi:Lon protease-like protein
MHLDDAVWVGHRLAEILPMPAADKQQCLELCDPLRRLDVLAPMVRLAEAAGKPDA